MGEWDEGAHLRDESGRFGSGGDLKKWAEKRAGRYASPMADKVQREGGFTYKPHTELGKERVPKEGIMVSRPVSEKLGHVVELAKMAHRDPPPTKQEMRTEIRASVKTWLEKALPAARMLGPDHYVGGWMETDKKSGDVIAMHFDVSQKFDTKDRQKAIDTGKARNQAAIWHIEKGEEIDTGGTGR